MNSSKSAFASDDALNGCWEAQAATPSLFPAGLPDAVDGLVLHCEVPISMPARITDGGLRLEKGAPAALGGGLRLEKGGAPGLAFGGGLRLEYENVGSLGIDVFAFP
jgi:hypothetical protein